MKDNSYFPCLHRVLHWTIAFGILFMFLTIFLRSGWLNTKTMATVMTDTLAAKGVVLSQKDAMDVARQFWRPVGLWHTYVGYALVGLFGVRLTYWFGKGAKFPSPLAKTSTPKQKLQGVAYIAFYAALAGVLVTGLLLKFGSKDLHNTFKTIHSVVFYGLVAFVVLHLVGIVIGEKTDEKGIVSKMIGGHGIS